jgi:hypothetical protein
MKNENEIKRQQDIFTEVLSSDGVPEELAQEAANILAKENQGHNRTKEENFIVRTAWRCTVD